MSEIFPLEVRGQAISSFFAVAQGTGALGPVIYGALIGDTTNRTPLMWGHILGAALMIFGGIVAWYFGIAAEGQILEDHADPLSTISEEAST